ncbi:MAG TPA: cupin domain-containing protein [Phycisphaerae bacterium]|nr:cupin domain-containing protein [Phycisphaerae bacterium]
MDLINAIAKVRFSSARPQRVHLHKGKTLLAELLCMEPGQHRKIDRGQWAYYVITGAATITIHDKTSDLSAGQFAAVGPGEPHTVANAAEQRLVCLAITNSS